MFSETNAGLYETDTDHGMLFYKLTVVSERHQTASGIRGLLETLRYLITRSQLLLFVVLPQPQTDQINCNSQ